MAYESVLIFIFLRYWHLLELPAGFVDSWKRVCIANDNFILRAVVDAHAVRSVALRNDYYGRDPLS